MSKLKARLAVLLVVVVGVIGFGGIAEAQAANCTLISTSSTYWTGYDNKLKFDAHIQGCTTDVNQVQFTPASGQQGAGWNDLGWSIFIPATMAYYPATQTYISGSPGPVQTYSETPWCAHATHTVHTVWSYRIHNSSGGGSWGAWHNVYSANYNIIC